MVTVTVRGNNPRCFHARSHPACLAMSYRGSGTRAGSLTYESQYQKAIVLADIQAPILAVAARGFGGLYGS